MAKTSLEQLREPSHVSWLNLVRVIFLGSPAFALPSLEALRTAGHEVALVVTQPDRPAGRGQKTTPSPVAVYARKLGLPLWQTTSVRGTEAEARLAEVGAEAMILAAFAALIPSNVLGLTPRGVLNVHPSLLPRWRGAAPIQAALLSGDAETGVSIIRLVKALDAGPIFVQETVPISEQDDYVTLEPRLAKIGGQLVTRVLDEWPEPCPQDDSAATFTRRIEREDARIDWARPAREIWNAVRAYRGWPGAFTTFDGRVLKVLRATPTAGTGQPGVVGVEGGAPLVATGNGALRLDEVQLEGRRAMSGEELLRGYAALNGAKLA